MSVSKDGANGHGTNGKPLIEFPILFPLKAIGTGVDDFEAFVLAIVRKHVPDLPDSASRSRLSSRGRYLAVTVTFVATSQAQLDAIYSELSAHTRVVMLL
jgi:putative lipoic acid-binding regulatory protein